VLLLLVSLTWIAIFRGNSTVMKCGWGPSELKGKEKSSGLKARKKLGEKERREGCMERDTHCQNVSGS